MNDHFQQNLSKIYLTSNLDYSMTEDTITLPEIPLSLSAQIESLLFVAPGAVTISQLANALGETNRTIEMELEALVTLYQERGIRLQRHGGRVQFVSAPESAPIVEHFLGLEATSSLSRAALETMAIVAYQQPVTRPQIESVRGVNSDGVMKTLLSKGLIQEVGRADGPGRPILYSTTPEFLGYFGLTSIEELPSLNIEEINHRDVPEEQLVLKE
jgi:segregation and condensation protein B